MPQEQSNENKPKTGDDYANMAKSLIGDTAVEQPTVATKATSEGEPAKVDTYQDKVNGLIKQVTVGEDGKLIYPDDTPDDLKYAVAAEKKYRDTQGGFTKSQQSLKEIEEENKALREQLASSTNSTLELSKEDTERLEDLKFNDPDGWMREMNELNDKHSKSVHQKLNETMGEVKKKAGAKFELDRRVKVLESFNKGRETPITTVILDSDIPPRISKKLADGHTTFEGYLAEVDEYLSKGKVVNNVETDNGTKLTNGAGSSTAPTQETIAKEGTVDYSNLTF